MEIELHKIVDVSKCYEILRSVRWDGGLMCPHCSSGSVVKNGVDVKNKEVQHYKCKDCGRYFDDLTNTIFMGSHYGIDAYYS